MMSTTKRFLSKAYTPTCLALAGLLCFCSANADPAWAPTGIVNQEGTQVLYAPRSARVEEGAKGVKFRVIDSQTTTAKHQRVSMETWKVRADTCNNRTVDLIIHQNGQDIGTHRGVSMLTTKNPLTRKALLACNLPLME